eukprot:scaffold14625_cov125-Isochrysis_galbana.AAC.5
MVRHILEYRTHHGSALWWWTLQAKRMPWRALKRGAQAMYNTSEAQSDCALGSARLDNTRTRVTLYMFVFFLCVMRCSFDLPDVVETLMFRYMIGPPGWRRRRAA